jgi:hypothetical protein
MKMCALAEYANKICLLSDIPCPYCHGIETGLPLPNMQKETMLILYNFICIICETELCDSPNLILGEFKFIFETNLGY